MDDTVDTLDALKRMIEFFNHESCGKCTPCREGNAQMLKLLDKFVEGKATEEDLENSQRAYVHHAADSTVRAGSGRSDRCGNGAQVLPRGVYI